MPDVEALNRALFLRLNAGPATSAWAIGSAIAAADWLIYLLPPLLVALWLWGSRAQRNLAVKACLVALAGVGLNVLIGHFWVHPRPFMIPLGHTWMPHAADPSFPSDHMTVFTSLGLTFLLGRPRGLGALLLAAGLLVAWARVFLGVHFPLDMAGSVLVASFTLAVISPVWHRVGEGWVEVLERIYRALLDRPIAQGWTRR